VSDVIWQGVIRKTKLGELTKSIKNDNVAVGVLKHISWLDDKVRAAGPKVVIGQFDDASDLKELNEQRNLDELIEVTAESIVMDVEMAERLEKALSAAISAARSYQYGDDDVEYHLAKFMNLSENRGATFQRISDNHLRVLKTIPDIRVSVGKLTIVGEDKIPIEVPVNTTWFAPNGELCDVFLYSKPPAGTIKTSSRKDTCIGCGEPKDDCYCDPCMACGEPDHLCDCEECPSCSRPEDSCICEECEECHSQPLDCTCY